jgi:Skp family chaperone for outer membrane proteins
MNQVQLAAASRWARRLALASGGCLIVTAAAAQTATPAPTFGPPIAGACILAKSEAIDRSQAGVSANQQLTQFGQGIEAELKGQRTAIENDDRALAGQKASLSPVEFERRVAQLRQRYTSLNHTQTVRAAQLRLTTKDAIAQVTKIFEPSVADTITARHCSMVIERSVTYGSAEAMDITPVVIQKMDGIQSVVALRLATPEAAQAAH